MGGRSSKARQLPPPSRASCADITCLSLILHTVSSLGLVARHPDGPVRARAVPRAVALGRLAPRRLRDAALGLAAPAAVRVVHAVHCHAAHAGAAPLPARGARLAELGVLVLRVGEHAHGGQAAAQQS